jgi:mRNA-degrading endonuclease RelE of RelBE toxin-antitoxin system
MQSELEGPVRVEFTPELKRNLRALSKKYRHIRSDIQPIIGQLESGEIIGDQVPGVQYTIFKARIKNSDIRKGKRSCYRLLYYLKSPKNVILITLYSKLDQSDISAREIKQIIAEFDKSPSKPVM